MNKLTSFSKLIILLVIIGALYFFGKTFFTSKYELVPKAGNAVRVEGSGSSNNDSGNSGNSANANNNQQAPSNSNSSNSQSSNTSANTNAQSSFAYKAPKPIGGQLMGVVELGASGFNSFIINKDSDDNWEKVKYEWGNSLVADGMANNQDVTSGLKRYIGNILDYGVGGKNIHFVVSSGAQKEPEVQPIIAALKKMGYVVNTVTPEQEGEYALKSVLPSQYEGKAFVVDIGSGNTKVSWMQNGRVSAKEAAGAKYYNKGIGDSQAYNEAKTTAKMVPQNLSKTCFIIGGVPFNLAKKSRNGEERYTVLENPKNYAKLAEEKGKKVASGLNIYQGLFDGSGCKQFVFDWNANFTIGFLLALPG